MRADYQYALILDFDDIEGLRTYLTHPGHAALGHLFTSATGALAYDYEVFGLDDVRHGAI
jgi:Stress responsive A/B Barrel Domain